MCIEMLKSTSNHKNTDDGRSVATNFTLGFINRHLSGRSRILEVGSGLGHLAWELSRAGNDVLAIDTGDDAVNATTAKGVQAKLTRIEDLDEGNFDAILFTRSLHHIRPIDSCLDAARKRLKTGGRLRIEDFGFDLVDKKTALWFQGLKNSFAPVFKKDDWSRPLDSGLQEWRHHHTGEHELHTAKTLLSEIEKRFSVVEIQRNVPYLFRYFVGQETPTADLVRSIFLWEEALIQSKAIVGIGLRIVAKI